MGSIVKQAGWIALALLGAFALGTVALARGETINALWIVVAAVAVYPILCALYCNACDATRCQPRNASGKTQ